MAASATIRYTYEDSPQSIQAMISDISLSGMGVYLDTPIREDTGLLIDISFISSEGLMTTASLQGESVYVREMGGMHFIGIEFNEEINPVKQPSLHDHLQKILR